MFRNGAALVVIGFCASFLLGVPQFPEFTRAGISLISTLCVFGGIGVMLFAGVLKLSAVLDGNQARPRR